MEKFSDVLINAVGRPIQGATVTVRTAAGATTATIYSDNGTTPKDNPFTTGSMGGIDFYAANGKYNISVSVATSTAVNVVPVILFDPDDSSFISDS